MAPGASVRTVKIGVVPLWLLVTTMLFKVMLPALLRLPVKVSRPPGLTGLIGQFWVIAKSGVVMIGQMVVAVLVTPTPQRLWAMAVDVLVLEQLVGAR